MNWPLAAGFAEKSAMRIVQVHDGVDERMATWLVVITHANNCSSSLMTMSAVQRASSRRDARKCGIPKLYAAGQNEVTA